jgi:ribonuclease Z
MQRWGVALSSVRVCHCNLAYGVVVVGRRRGAPAEEASASAAALVGAAAEATWKVVYSGDTRPGGPLIAAGKDCDVLIHEATFEDDKEALAKKKRHSTVGEAVAAGRKMGARRTVLTHFSQRYPKLVRSGGAICAFDFMRFQLADLEWLGGIGGAVEQLLGPREEERGAVAAAEEEGEIVPI